MQQPIAVLYEHPEWFKPLFAELDRRDVPYVAVDHQHKCARCERFARHG